MAQQPPAPPPPPPPPGAYGGPAPYGARPGSFTGPAIFLLIVGILGVLYAVVIFVGAGQIGEAAAQLEELGLSTGDVGAIRSVLYVLGVVLLIVHGLQLVGGIRLFSGRGRGLATGVAIAGGVVWLIILLLGLAQGTVDIFGLLMALAAIAAAIGVPLMVRRAA
jgi:hypothetical protein